MATMMNVGTLSSSSSLFIIKPTISPKPLSFLPPNHNHHHHHHHHQLIVFSSSSSSSSSSSRNNNSETECPVPLEQQPVKEYESLSTSFPFSWASADLVEYSSRLAATGASFALFVGLPVACFGGGGAAASATATPVKCAIGAVSSGLFVVTLAVLRMYLGWSYVGNRLLSATVEYEETGWYDGQLWVKTAEVLARDRLLGSFSVKPVLNRLKYTLVVLGASLFICILLLINIEGTQNDSYSPSEEAGGRAVPGVYNDDSARSFEPDAFCGELGVL